MKKLKMRNVTQNSRRESMEEEWISLNEFMRRKKIGYEVAQQMIEDHEVEFKKTAGGRYKIKVGGNSVSRELYEQEKEKRIQAETKLSLLKKILVEGEKENEN